jgi:hypothetical protein
VSYPVPTRPVATLEARGAPHSADANAVRGIFTTATNRQFTQLLDGPGSASFEFQYFRPDGSTSPDLALIDPTNTDICFWVATDYGPQCLFRGRLTDAQLASGQGGQVIVRCQCRDYKALLAGRDVLDADCDKMVITGQTEGPLQRNYRVGVDLGSAVWDLIRITQAKAFGTYGITSSGDGVPTSPATMTRDDGTVITIPSNGNKGRTWSGGNGTTGITFAKVWEMTAGTTSITDEINSMAAGNEGSYDFGSGPVGTQGFEWDIVPDPTSAANKLHLWTKAYNDGRGRGSDAQWVLDWGGSVAGFTTDWSTDMLGTFLRLTMNSWTGNRQIDASSLALGRWERQVSLASPFAPNFTIPPGAEATYQPIMEKIDKAAAHAFFNDTRIRFAYTVTLPPTLDPTSQLGMALGDTARIQVPTLNGPSNAIERIVGRTVTVTDNGDIGVQLSLAKLPIFTTGGRAREQQRLAHEFRRMLNGIHGGTFAS